MIGALLAAPAAAERPVRVGSKVFTEGVILGELLTRMCVQQGVPAEHRRELGGTQVLYQALRAGDIDLYPEYTGTLREQIFAAERERARDLDGLRGLLAEHGLRLSAPLGFDDSYALAVRAEVAQRDGLHRISDLRQHPGLRLGLSNEFMDRADGWPGLRRHYRLPQTDVRGLDHDLAYRGLQGGTLDGTEVYSTDAEISYYRLRVLDDDEGFFPSYQAVVLYRADLPAAALRAVQALEGRIRTADMTAMNRRAKLDRVPEEQVAADFLRQRLGVSASVLRSGAAARIWRHTREHLFLVLLSLPLALLIGVPLGVLAARRRALGQVVLGTIAAIQTMPSLALLVFMIPLLGIGTAPAVVALFLYSLLPIVRSTHSGLVHIPGPLRESAEALGMGAWARLWHIELPLAAPAILAGVQTAAVLNVGIATIGAIVGAGGYGQPILTGIRLADTALVLQGAVPAVVLALLVQGLFELLGRVAVPRGLRVKPPA